DRNVFDFYGGMYGLLISTLPLADGYAAEIPAFDTDKMAIDWVPVRVKGRESIPAGMGKKTETWVVETPTKLYGRMTWWVTKEPPYVIKAVLEIPKDEGGSGEVAAIVTYTMVELVLKHACLCNVCSEFLDSLSRMFNNISVFTFTVSPSL